jgi:hypothetical protein
MTPAGGRRTARDGDRRVAAAASRSLAERLDDPDEPLYTMAVAADLLETDDQTLRRLGDALGRRSARPSGNQRRYSRRDLEGLESALDLAREGHPPQSIARILDLQRQLTEGPDR